MITLDYTNCLAEAIGATHGLQKDEVQTLAQKFPKHHENVDLMRKEGESAFFDLPYQNLADLKALAKKHQGKWDNLVVVGTGGSTLAARTIVDSLGHPHAHALDGKARGGAPRVFTLHNADPQAATLLLESLDLKKTLVQVVSRSGATIEAIAGFALVADALKKKVGKTAVSSQVVITTDPGKGALAEIAKLEKIDVLPAPGNLTGRYALLGPQALFAAALCNISVEKLLAGAGDMDKRCRHGDVSRNPAYMHALVHYLLTRKRRKTMHAMFAFANRLQPVARWYDHQLSVSLGKMLNRKGKAVHVGPSPVSALGGFDLHGQHQLFAEGPFDKVVTFIDVLNHGPKVAVANPAPKVAETAWLKEVDFAQLIAAQQVVAEQQLTAAGRPSCTLHLDHADEAHVGGLVQLLLLSTAMSAELYGINPFDQSNVDSAKQATVAQFGRPGFEDLAKRIKEYKAKPRRTC